MSLPPNRSVWTGGMLIAPYDQGVTTQPPAPTPGPGTTTPPRTRILESASAAIARRGYNGTSLEKIATGAGLSKAGVLHHFSSKDEILSTILRERDEIDFLLEENASTSIDMLRDLVMVAQRDIADIEQTRVFALLLGEAVGLDNPIQDWFRARYDRLRTRLAGGISEAMFEGVVRPETDAAAIAAEALAMMDGLQFQFLLDGNGESYVHRLNGYIERTIASISTRD